MFDREKGKEKTKTLASFKNIHKGETIIVCGCGSSLNDLTHPERFITIGVNDVGRRFHPDYLVILNPPRQFAGDRFHYVRTSQAKYLFTQLDIGSVQPPVVRFQLGEKGGTDFSDPNVLHYTENSPYVALCLAVHMGAARIGLTGVDFTDHHFFDKTGDHVLSPYFTRIDDEYRRLAQKLEKQGIEVINLSRQSRLTAFRKGTIKTPAKTKTTIKNKENTIRTIDQKKKYKIFFVNYKFLSCGDVFRHGLAHAAQALGLQHAEAYWDEDLPGKIRQFNPDLVFVVHGRKFARRWKNTFRNYNTAVWLLDEPYEVDDTCGFSGYFDTVFVNDPNTINRHENAHYLPVCFDPEIYFDVPGPKKYGVGFIGGCNPVRQRMLEILYDEGLLSYVVGGPWKGEKLNRICLANNIPHEETAALYKQTKIILNIFRFIHHFNRHHVPAASLNPRIFEALACGAVVVSENRPEMKRTFPALPVFEDAAQMTQIVRELLQNDKKLKTTRDACKEKLKGNTFSHRLKTAIDIAGNEKIDRASTGIIEIMGENQESTETAKTTASDEAGIFEDWLDYGHVSQPVENGMIVLKKNHDKTSGSERGLVSKNRYINMELCFDVNVDNGSIFIAKILQEEQLNQLSNSYHLFCGTRDYFARHYHIFNYLTVRRNSWENIRIVFNKEEISFYQNQLLLFSFKDRMLKRGYAFLGTKGGEIRLRNIAVRNLTLSQPKYYDLQSGRSEEKESEYEYDMLVERGMKNVPVVSIITTVYDRVECLKNCIKSVKQLVFKNYEHIIVADSPPPHILRQLQEVVAQEKNGRITFANLNKRYNNWGIKPASVGINLSCGRYICFLSDDNGYIPDHMGPLVEELERTPYLGFVYSSCRYDGRKVLDSPVPKPGRIDLGQPLFRRELFGKYLNNTLHFNMMAWDWHMIDTFMKKKVRWKHINKPSFLFRLRKYPHLIPRQHGGGRK